MLTFYRQERERTGNFEAGIEMALRRILADPEFIFRFEPAPAGAKPGIPYRISDTELASRLSFFLWSTIPDDELLKLAIDGKLHEPAVLEKQARRMLADPKARALVTNFANQWLYLRDLKNANPDVTVFPDFDDNLRQGFQRETEMLFESIMREDRSVLDLLDANYTFVNERLAKHYGIPNVYGPDFRRVPVPSDARRGLLGHGSLLLVTSNANRTSPVIRGKWILENLLGSQAPLPPPDVPPLEEKPTAAARSVRERIEQHRANPACASCHKIMDPIGLALENFDAIGRWRTTDEGVRIDGSGQLVDGSRAPDPVIAAAAIAGSVLRHVPQRETQDRRARARHLADGSHRDQRRDLGESRPQSSRGPDAARRCEAARPRIARRVRHIDRRHHRPLRRQRPEPGTRAAASHEPRGVRQRDSRSPRARRRSIYAASRGRLEPRLRQHRGRARRLAIAARALRLRGREDQQARGRRT